MDDSLNVDSLNGQRYMYVFLSNDELSAGISGNSDIGTGGAAKDNHRITSPPGTAAPTRAWARAAPLWYYDRNISSSDPPRGGQRQPHRRGEGGGHPRGRGRDALCQGGHHRG